MKEKLDYQNLTQRQLAEKIGTSYNTLQSWINRNRLPNAEQAVKVAEALHTSVEFLVNGRRSPNKSDHSRTVRLLAQAIENLQKDL